jgi:hypothetical protein
MRSISIGDSQSLKYSPRGFEHYDWRYEARVLGPRADCRARQVGLGFSKRV